MRVLFCIMALLLFAAPAVALVIDKDTVWEGEQSFSEEVSVLPGVTLTVRPGALIRFAGAGLKVAGRLLADGAEFSAADLPDAGLSGGQWQGIQLKANDATTRLRDCLISGAATGVFIQGGLPQLERLTLARNKVGVEVRGKAAGEIIDCRFLDNAKVGLFIKEGSTTSVVDCFFSGNEKFGAYLYRALPESFRGNRFNGNATGLMVAYHGSDPLIEANRFIDNEVAIKVDRAARPLLRDNLLRDNRTGLYVYRRSDPQVTGNRIEANGVGLLVAYSSYPQVAGNDFSGNDLALKLEYQSSRWEQQQGAKARATESASRSAFSGQNARSVTEDDRRARNMDGRVSAQGNWWGEAGTDELKKIGSAGNPSFIHDGRDQQTFVDAGQTYPLDKVTYSDWSERSLTEINQ